MGQNLCSSHCGLRVWRSQKVTLFASYETNLGSVYKEKQYEAAVQSEGE